MVSIRKILNWQFRISPLVLNVEAFQLEFNPPVPLARELLREYAAQLGIDLCFQEFETELAELPGRYAPPKGCFLLAYSGPEATGCGAFRPLSDDLCEMKRVYVRPAYRGQALGRTIAEVLLKQAQLSGYRAMRLDTLVTMRPAISLYQSLGFQKIQPYYENPIEDSVFMELNLRGAL